MAVKKTTPAKHHKKVSISEPPIDHIPDIFDEDGASSVIPSVKPGRGPTVVEVEDITIDVVEPDLSVPTIPEMPEEENDLPTPTVPFVPRSTPSEPELVSVPESDELSKESTAPMYSVRSNGQDVEPQLPSFFTQSTTAPVSQTIQEEESNVRSVQDTTMLEAMVPQAFVGEVREVATEAKQEKKGALVTFFIIVGMILVAGGVVGLYLISTHKSTPAPSPSPIVDATPLPTPVVVVNTATSSAQTIGGESATTKLKVNVLNGTTTKGLAAKEAAVLKKSGYVIGETGNGDPKLKGTIIVPTGQTDVATGIQSALSGFTFTVKEDAKATSITVVLGEPQ